MHDDAMKIDRGALDAELDTAKIAARGADGDDIVVGAVIHLTGAQQIPIRLRTGARRRAPHERRNSQYAQCP